MRTRKRAKDVSLDDDEPKEKKPKVDRPKEKCKACGKVRVLLAHLSRTPKCREQYPELETLKKQAKKARDHIYHKEHSEQVRAAKRQNYQKNRVKICLIRKAYGMKNRQALREKQKKRDHARKFSKTSDDRIKQFKRSIQGGLNYDCESCDRQFFRGSVRILSEKQATELKAKCGLSFLKTVLPNINFRIKFPLVVLCHNCYSKIKSKKCPSINVSNGFSLDDVPEELKLTDLEQQLIAKVLLFMKVLPMTKKSKVPKIIDRVINVPLHDEDISKTISSLPRSLDDAAVVDVMFKRKLDLKNPHNHEFIKRSTLIKALKKLKELKNPFYVDVIIDETSLNTEVDAEMSEVNNAEVSEEDSSDESEVHRGGFGTNTKTLTDADTCLVPIHLESDVVVAGDNTDAAKSIELAPGIYIGFATSYPI